MAQIFHPSFNTLSKVSLFGAIFFLGAALWAWDTTLRSPYVTQVNVAREQPIPFSHKHHVQGLGLDCRYCHWPAEAAASAGVPPTKTCMTCHSVVWKDAPLIQPIHESWRSDEPIEWVRVHDLPDFAYFDHSIHLAKGMGCTTCHGEVDEMPLMWRENTLHMAWCLECHRNPEAFIRPREEVWNPDWDPGSITREERAALIEEYGVRPQDNCSICHQ